MNMIDTKAIKKFQKRHGKMATDNFPDLALCDDN